VQTAELDAFFSDNQNMKVMNLNLQGNAAKEGILHLVLRNHVESHKTDFGWSIPSYDVETSADLSFRNGQLIGGSIAKYRPGFSKFVLDPDFQGGEVPNCQ
jgi:hypothetical protein